MRLDSATVTNGIATIRFSGNMRLGGACGNPRVEAQLQQTALQFSSVEEVQIFLNGESLESSLSGS